MRTHTQEFKSKIKEHGRQFNDTLYYSANGVTTTYDSEHLSNINYSFDTSLLKSVMQTLTFDSDLDLEVGNIVSYKCSLVDVQDSDIELNNFTITKKEEQKDTNNYRYTCYDNMIKSMTDYVSLNVTYPITIRNYLSAICTHLGITFGSSSNNFTNYNQNITSEHYLDSDGHSIGYTFRDVLDDLAEATGSFICIDNNGNLIVKGTTITSDTINEEYFQDNNVNIGKKYGPINVVTLSRNGVDNLVRPSTLPQNITEIKIENNPILDQTNREDFINGIYNNLNGLEFYLNDFQTLGVMYYEVGDIYNVSIDNTTYQCLMLNDNIIRESGLTENIYTEEPTTSVTDYKYASDTDKLEKTSRNAYFLADKANGTAEMIVQGIGDNGQVTGASVIASINDDSSNLTLNADKINLNGAVTANNNFKIKNDGSVEINNGNILLYDDGTDTIDAVISVYEEGQGTNIKDTEIYSYGVRIYRNAGGYTNYFTDLSYNGLNHEISPFDTSQPQYQFSLTTDELLLSKRAGTTGHPTLDYAIYGNTENCIEIGYSNNAYFRVKRTNNDCDMYLSGNATIGGKLIIPKDGSKGIYDDTSKPILYINTNNNVVLNASGGTLLLGYSNTTTGINFLNGKARIDPSTGMYKVGTTDLIEEGSNTDGYYIKYANGTMICWTKKSVTTAITTAWGVLYESSSAIDLGNFPVAFISTPSITATINSQRAAFIESVYNSSSTAWGNTYLVRPMSTNSNSYEITLMAIGKWK